MIRPPPAPVVSAALSGFVVGVFVGLIATGVVHRTSASSAPPTLPPVRAVADQQLAQRIRKMVERQLGPLYPNQKKPRLIRVGITPVEVHLFPHFATDRLGEFRSVGIVFRLNDHPLGKSWRLRAAKADVFAILKALYTSQLPIYNVELQGYFPVGKGKKARRVLIVYMDHRTAATIPWKRWGREFEGRVWTALGYRYVNPQFG